MANLVSYAIPNLIQGISQQPDSQRDPSQGEIQINGVSSIAEGLRKRENTTVLAKVSTTGFGDAFFHSILRDQSQEYLAVITPTVIKVFDLAGTEIPVNADTNAYNYLSTVTDARQQIRAVTIADYTFITNTNTVAAMDPAKAPEIPRPSAHECLVWIKQAAYGNLYRVNCNSIESTVQTPVSAVQNSGSTIIENRISSEDIADGLRRGFVGGAVATETFETGLTGSLNATRTDVDTVVDGAVGAQGMQVSITGDGTNITAITKTANGSGYEAGDEVSVFKKELEADGYTGDDAFDLVKIATVNSVGAGPLTGVTIQRSGAVLWFQSASAITIEATDAKANSTITAILNDVQSFTELPTIAPEGYQVEITGDPGNNFDNYYVEFVPRSGTFSEGSWEETVRPGDEYKIDADTMPHALIRQNNGEFWFGALKGQAVAQIPDDVPEWGKRTCGDSDETAKDPSFIGNSIADIFIYKNRLGFLADENVILSRTREFFSFFPETVTTVLDTDPIDVIASNNRVSVLAFAVPYQDELILFSAQYQFRFNAAETVLTPRTAQLTVLTQFEVDTTVRPQQAGGGIIFAQQNGEWTQLREFSVRGAGTALTADAADLTGYVSSYVPSEIFKMTVNDTGNGLYAISGRNVVGGIDYRNRIYTYKYFYRNTGSGAERVQSSWSHFELTGADEVLQVLCVEEILYVLTRYGNDVYLESMPVGDREPETGGVSQFKLLLDRRVTNTTATPAPLRIGAATYDDMTDQTTFTLPYDAAAKTQLWTIWDESDPSSLAPVLLGEITSGNTVVCKGDQTTQEVAAGEAFEFRYRFTKFKMMREIGGGKAAANEMRTQVRNAYLRFHESAYFQVKTLPEHRPSGLYTYDGTVSGVKNAAIGRPAAADLADNFERYAEGVFTIPVYGRGDQVYVEILSDRPLPCKFSTCEWVALLTTRARALQ